ncbi:MAG TPA: hypothetical protein VGG34_06110 [Opitutaceae bacterium]
MITSNLEPGERLLWTGQPQAGVRLRRTDLVQIPFSLLWGGFAFFWEYAALTDSRGAHAARHQDIFVDLFPLFGIPFVLAGLYLIFGRFFYDAWARSRTYYGITSTRVVIAKHLFSLQVKSLQLRTLSDVTLDQRGDGSGSITFGSGSRNWWRGSGWPGGRRDSAPAFELIERAASVYETIRLAQRSAT